MSAALDHAPGAVQRQAGRYSGEPFCGQRGFGRLPGMLVQESRLAATLELGAPTPILGSDLSAAEALPSFAARKKHCLT